MRPLLTLLLLTIGFSNVVNAQKYLTKNGQIRFFSEAPMENIEATNNQVTSILDMTSGDIVFSLLMKGFHFEKALMEEHFNEKYVHSDKYPKSSFKGNIAGLEDLSLSTGELFEVPVSGTLTLHGVERELETTATLQMKDGRLHASAVFPLTLSAFDITIPGVVKDNIAKEVEVTVTMIYDPYNK